MTKDKAQASPEGQFNPIDDGIGQRAMWTFIVTISTSVIGAVAGPRMWSARVTGIFKVTMDVCFL
jgi:hypothetical protein